MDYLEIKTARTALENIIFQELKQHKTAFENLTDVAITNINIEFKTTKFESERIWSSIIDVKIELERI